MHFTLYFSTKNSVDKRPWADHKSVPIAQSIDGKIVKKLQKRFPQRCSISTRLVGLKREKKECLTEIRTRECTLQTQHTTTGL